MLCYYDSGKCVLCRPMNDAWHLIIFIFSVYPFRLDLFYFRFFFSFVCLFFVFLLAFFGWSPSSVSGFPQIFALRSTVFLRDATITEVS